MNRCTLPAPGADWALFLDVDGTIVEIADHPERTSPARDLPALLQALATALNGAVAVISGRPIDRLDDLLRCPGLPMAGIHGLERRDATGAVHRHARADDALAVARAAVEAFVADHPGTHYEDKALALALHFRTAPHLRDATMNLMSALAADMDGFSLQAGKCVIELKPSGRNKGTAVAEFLAEPPYRGRIPVFVGDDVTDEDAFRLVQARGGHAIRVGHDPGSAARWHIDSVPEVLEWLWTLPESLKRPKN